jgi:hypothetical protein
MVAPGDDAWDLFVEEFSRFMGWHEEPAPGMTGNSAS